jgi:hypothetical protein
MNRGGGSVLNINKLLLGYGRMVLAVRTSVQRDLYRYHKLRMAKLDNMPWRSSSVPVWFTCSLFSYEGQNPSLGLASLPWLLNDRINVLMVGMSSS